LFLPGDLLTFPFGPTWAHFLGHRGNGMTSEFSLALPDGWDDYLGHPSGESWWRDLETWYGEELARHTVYPPKAKVFEALRLVEPGRVKVVILGQDPYHSEGQAHGLAFSVPRGVQAPPSLVNIHKEILRSLADTESWGPPPSDLTSWAQQGVLLLNTVLSVRANEAFSHQNRGWETLTGRILSQLGADPRPMAFLLWGNPAKTHKPKIRFPGHLILESSHPSPLSAYRGFLGCGHFTQVNAWLREQGQTPIDWFLGTEGLVR